jgi:hypothetical protein
MISGDQRAKSAPRALQKLSIGLMRAFINPQLVD